MNNAQRHIERIVAEIDALENLGAVSGFDEYRSILERVQTVIAARIEAARELHANIDCDFDRD